MTIHIPNVHHRALLIIDMQQGFMNASTRHLATKIPQIAQMYRHVFASQLVFSSRAPKTQVVCHSSFIEGSPETKLSLIWPENVSKTFYLFAKHHYTCIGSALSSLMMKNNIHHIDLCGVDSEACVLKTALDFYEMGFSFRVLESLCASSQGPAYHEAAMDLLRTVCGPQHMLIDRPIQTYLPGSES